MEELNEARLQSRYNHTVLLGDSRGVLHMVNLEID